jgi:hypothetical protein
MALFEPIVELSFDSDRHGDARFSRVFCHRVRKPVQDYRVKGGKRVAQRNHD